MARDYSNSIRQLTQARENCVTAIAGWEKASENDKADRSDTIASARRDMASYDCQLADLAKKQAEEAAADAAKAKPAKTDKPADPSNK